MTLLTRRRLLRQMTRGGLVLGLAPLVSACGQPATPPMTGGRGAAAATPGSPTVAPTATASPGWINPYITPGPTPPAYVTPFPTGFSTRPVSTQPPTPAFQVIPTTGVPTPVPTKQPSDAYRVGAIGHGALGIAAGMRRAHLILRGTVLEIRPDRWTTPDGTRPPNPHLSPAPATIFRPVLVQVTQVLKGQPPDTLIYLLAFGGTVGSDEVLLGGDIGRLSSFRVGGDYVLFLGFFEGNNYPLINGQPLLGVDEVFVVLADGQATNGHERMPLQQLLDEIMMRVRTPMPNATPTVR